MHYPAIHTIIAATCQEYAVEYVEYNSLGSAVRSHLRYLHQLSKA